MKQTFAVVLVLCLVMSTAFARISIVPRAAAPAPQLDLCPTCVRSRAGFADWFSSGCGYGRGGVLGDGVDGVDGVGSGVVISSDFSMDEISGTPRGRAVCMSRWIIGERAR